MDTGMIVNDKMAREVLDKAKAVGMRFNPSKCQFRKTQVKIFGLILSRQGVSPDPTKIDALRRLPEMKNYCKVFLVWLITCQDLILILLT